jgi:hypothetical protein
MVREAARRGLIAGLLAAAAVPAVAEDLCATLRIPAGLDLDCMADASAGPGAVAIGPTGDALFAPLSRMTLRELDAAGADAEAFNAPERWLRARTRLDLAGVGRDLESGLLGPDSPFAGEAGRSAISGLVGLLESLDRLVDSACEAPRERRAGRWEVECRYALGGVTLLRELRLVRAGERVYAIELRSMNEQRLRHFQALANSFEPAG